MKYPYVATASFRRHRIAAWFMLASLCSSVIPATVSANPPAPDQMVRHTAESVMQEIRLRNAEFVQEPEKLYWLVEEQLVPHFDFDLISQLVLGRYWGQASPEQRERFATAFQHLLVRQYAKTLLAFQNDSFEWKPFNLPPDDTDINVESSILRSGAPALAVNYRLHRVTDKWLVYDLSIDGVSLVTNYRGMFVHQVRAHGLDAVIGQLEKKISS
jgi:phospholipid transport system substrate-binding protein